MTNRFETIVVGLGAVGSAATYHLARRGVRVLGLDRHAPPHTLGSSHGGSRIVRRAYFEGHHFLPLLTRSWQLWRDLEQASRRPLITACGSLSIGRTTRDIVTEARRSAEALGLAHAVLDPAETARRFPGFRIPDGEVAVLEVDAGLVSPEEGVRAHLELASHHGATLGVGQPVLEWSVGRGHDSVAVTTARDTYQAGSLVLAGGSWMPELLPTLGGPLVIERVVTVWFQPRAQVEAFGPSRCPVFIWEYDDDRVAYGCPDLGHGVKVGLHHQGSIVGHPDEVRREATLEEIDRTRPVAARLLPDACGTVRSAGVCLYTNTPDKNFLLDRHPEHPQVVYASPCSGHGFKMSPAVGETLADLATGAPPDIDVTPFGYRW